MERNKFVIILLLLSSAINSFGQKTYLNYPFYRDGISNLGSSYYYMRKQDINTPRTPTPDWYYIGYSYGLVKNTHFNNGIGLHWGLQWLESLMPIGDFYQYAGIEMSVNSTLHLDFKLPLSNDFAFGFHTGPGLTVSYLGVRTEKGYTHRPFQGVGLKRFDFSYDCAIYMEIIRYRLEVSWSKGLTDHYGKYHRNKLMIGVVYFPFE